MVTACGNFGFVGPEKKIKLKRAIIIMACLKYLLYSQVLSGTSDY